MEAQTIVLQGERREVTPLLIDELLAQRVRNTPGPALLGYSGSVVFHTGRVSWTLDVTEDKVSFRRGATRSPTAQLWLDMTTLANVISGRRSGAEAFHEGSLVVRGRVALTLLLDGAFLAPEERPPNTPIPGQVMAQGVTTTYLQAGPVAAPPVLLLHGVGATNATMLPLMLDLAGDYRVLAPDLPGHGGSSAPPWTYSSADFAHWVRAFLNRIGVDRAVIVGNSLGGRIAMETGLRHPEVVDKLVMLTPSTAFRRLTEAQSVVRLIPPIIGLLPAPLHDIIVRYVLRSLFADHESLPASSLQAAADEFIGVMESRRHRVAFLAALRQIYLEEAFGMRGFWGRLPNLAAPSLFVWGDHDWLVPASYSEHIQQCLPNAESVVLRNCGHVPQFEHPAETARMVRQFLATGSVQTSGEAVRGFPAVRETPRLVSASA